MLTIFDVAARLRGVKWDGKAALSFICPIEGHNHRGTCRELPGGLITLGCVEPGNIWKAIGLEQGGGEYGRDVNRKAVITNPAPAPSNPLADPPQPSHGPAREQKPDNPPPARAKPPERPQGTAATDILRRTPPQSLEAEQSVLGAILLVNESIEQATSVLARDDFYFERHRLIFGSMQELWRRGGGGIDGVTLTAELKRHGQLETIGGGKYIAEIAGFVPTAANIEFYARIVHEAAGKRRLASIFTGLASDAYNGVSLEALVGEAERQLKPVLDSEVSSGEVIISEDYEVAIEANTEYLQRRPIIDRLGYTESIALAVGGKHHGKTTNVRTVALSVMRGLPVWGRATEQGHVIYVASDDEIASTRMELLRMGWNSRKDPLTLVRLKPGMATEPERVLEAVARLAERTGSILIILDMLFDFARIRDEMSYAQTREAIGKVQTLAQVSKAFVLATHHSPKYMPDAMTAATAALGSQGIAARFSPIILTRKWADGLYTVESTMTRDPRGLALPPTVVSISENGWAVGSEPFKSWMKWRVYGPRVIALFEGLEPGQTRTVQAVATELEIPRPEAQNALYRLFLEGELRREQRKRSMHYWMDKQEQIFDPREPD